MMRETPVDSQDAKRVSNVKNLKSREEASSVSLCWGETVQERTDNTKHALKLDAHFWVVMKCQLQMGMVDLKVTKGFQTVSYLYPANYDLSSQF